MMTVVKQTLNALYMYFYYQYYDYRMRTSRKFKVREAVKSVQENHRATLIKLAAYEREHPWR